MKKERTRFEELCVAVVQFRPGCSFSVRKDGKELRILAPTTHGGQMPISIDLARLGETPEEYMEKTLEEDKAQVCALCGKNVAGFKTIESFMTFRRGGGCQECQERLEQEVAGDLSAAEKDETDQVCESCGDPDCSKPFPHPTEEGGMDKVKEQAGMALLGRSRTVCMANGTCVGCGGAATEFRDSVSRREYQLSGFCQKCQDGLFG